MTKIGITGGSILTCEHCHEARPFHAHDCCIPLLVEALRTPVVIGDDE